VKKTSVRGARILLTMSMGRRNPNGSMKKNVGISEVLLLSTKVEQRAGCLCEGAGVVHSTFRGYLSAALRIDCLLEVSKLSGRARRTACIVPRRGAISSARRIAKIGEPGEPSFVYPRPANPCNTRCAGCGCQDRHPRTEVFRSSSCLTRCVPCRPLSRIAVSQHVYPTSFPASSLSDWDFWLLGAVSSSPRRGRGLD